MTALRVLIVDDSVTMRMMLRRLLSKDTGLDVVGVACDAQEARAMLQQLRPDIMTLDIEMPGTSGLEFLKEVMQSSPMPVVMCSSRFDVDADAIVEAMSLGAVDCIAKPHGALHTMSEHGDSICATVRRAGRSVVKARSAAPSLTGPGTAPAPRPVVGGVPFKIIGIGSSTGGVEALFRVIPALPATTPPIVVVQHMPANFTTSLAERLNRGSAMKVVEAEDGLAVRQGTVYIAPGGARHMTVSGRNDMFVRLTEGDPLNGHRPSVDRLFSSLVQFGGHTAGVILTGMGEDGARELGTMRRAGAMTIAQNRETCVVYGMPRAAVEMDSAAHVLPVDDIASKIIQGRRNNREAA